MSYRSNLSHIFNTHIILYLYPSILNFVIRLSYINVDNFVVNWNHMDLYNKILLFIIYYKYIILLASTKILVWSLYWAQGTWVGWSTQWNRRPWLHASALHPKPPQTVGHAGGGRGCARLPPVLSARQRRHTMCHSVVANVREGPHHRPRWGFNTTHLKLR